VDFSLVWVGDGTPRMEIAHVEQHGRELVAVGTQLGVAYELRYRLEPERLSLEVVGGKALDVQLGEADFFDLGWSPLFNSLPVLRDGFLERRPPRMYKMRWVDVPSLEPSLSDQEYEGLGEGLVRFAAGDFKSEITFDEAGFVLDYPGIGRRV
jgi:Putative glycolipid-binding